MKKILSVVLAFSLLTGVNANATSYDDSLYVSEEQYLNGPDYYSEEYQSELDLDDLYRSIQVQSSTDDEQPEQRTLTITGHLQENSYYCGPASAQIVIQHDTGTLYLQSTLASYMQTNSSNGTYVYRLCNALNTYTNKTYYYRLASQYSLFSYLYQNINNNKLMVLNMDMTYVDSTYTSHTGHYVVACGYYKSATGTPQTNKVYYYDPYSPHAGYHWATEAAIINGTNHNAGYFIC